MFKKVNHNVGNGNKFTGLYLCYKLYFIMYFLDTFLMNEILHCFNKHANGYKFSLCKNKRGYFITQIMY